MKRTRSPELKKSRLSKASLTAKTELAKYLRDRHPPIGDRIVAVEAADHPSDREIVAFANQHFKIDPGGLRRQG